jgi:hypothetical protein
MRASHCSTPVTFTVCHNEMLIREALSGHKREKEGFM